MASDSTVRAFAPANISLIFETYRGETVRETGSLGVGLTLSEGVTATLTRLADNEESEVLVAGQSWEFPTVRSVLAQLNRAAKVEIEADFTFGCGFGMSGASALATAFAARELFGLDHSDEELAMVAHVAEVENGTGLGDVGGQFTGGLMIKTEAFSPLSVFRLPIDAEQVQVRVFGPISTKEVINSREMLADINQSGEAALQRIKSRPPRTLEDLLDISWDFSRESGLMRFDTIQSAIDEVREQGGSASMIMLGEAVVATHPFTGSRPAQIAMRGPRVIPDPSSPCSQTSA